MHDRLIWFIYLLLDSHYNEAFMFCDWLRADTRESAEAAATV